MSACKVARQPGIAVVGRYGQSSLELDTKVGRRVRDSARVVFCVVNIFEVIWYVVISSEKATPRQMCRKYAIKCADLHDIFKICWG